MSLSDTVYKALLQEYHSGATQTAIAEKHNTKQPYIQRFLSGQRSCAGISLGLLEKMFPNATIDLEGRGVPQVQSKSPGAIQQSGSNLTITQITDASFRQKVYELAIKYSDEKGFILALPFLKELRELE